MTIEYIQTILKNAAKPCSEAQVRRYLGRLKIQRVGARQRPAQYPDDSAQRILTYLGIDKTVGQLTRELTHKAIWTAPLDTAASRLHSVEQLRKERKRARAAR